MIEDRRFNPNSGKKRKKRTQKNHRMTENNRNANTKYQAKTYGRLPNFDQLFALLEENPMN